MGEPRIVDRNWSPARALAKAFSFRASGSARPPCCNWKRPSVVPPPWVSFLPIMAALFRWSVCAWPVEFRATAAKPATCSRRRAIMDWLRKATRKKSTSYSMSAFPTSCSGTSTISGGGRLLLGQGLHQRSRPPVHGWLRYEEFDLSFTGSSWFLKRRRALKRAVSNRPSWTR